MGSLANQYISQSYTSLIHLGNDTTASATLVELQDGLGNGLGIYVNTEGDVSIDGALIVSGTFDIEGRIVVNDDVRINGNLAVSGATSLTGSLVVSDEITASAAFIQNDLNVGGTVFASKVITLIESSSIVFSSGSNILGDDISDTQTLNGDVIMSGSASLTGSMGISNDLEVKGNISSSTISGIGNVTSYSQSVDARLDIVEATASLYVPFSQSVEQQLTSLENFTSSTFVDFSQSVDSRLDFLEGPFSTSVDARLDALEAFTGSEGLLNTASFNAYTASTNADLDAIHQTTASLNTFSQSIQTNFNAYTQSNDIALNNLSQSVSASNFVTNERINTLSSFTGSYATTGSNYFVGNQTFSGSVEGSVVALSISAQTASMDLLSANFFTLTLVSGSNTHISAFNGTDGQTISLKVTQPTGGFGNVSFSPNVRFPQSFPYIATPSGSAVDILSFQTYDSSFIYGVAVNTMR
jgi:hypothetical protein